MLPSGDVTFVITDVEGSTRLFQELGDAYAEGLAQHRATLRAALERHRGAEVEMQGDSFLLAFGEPADALEFCADAQRDLAEQRLQARMGVHRGAAHPVAGHYVAIAVHQAARVAASAHGGQVVASDAVVSVAGELGRRSLELRSLGRYRLKDFGADQPLYQLCGPGLRAEFPALRVPPAVLGNLPVTRLSFVGRSDELSRLAAMLREPGLVTLVGVGGVGKTRLALQAASEAASSFRDAAWLVELAPVRDPAQLAERTLAALGLSEAPARDPLEHLTSYLRGRQLLLVLDNCEHLIEAATDLAQHLLASLPELTILATSRERLRVRGERVLAIEPLAVPDAGGVEELLEADAPRLFFERAAEAGVELEVDAETLRAVMDLCRRLDGLPLALELAAARTVALTPQQLVRRLDDRFRLLQGGHRGDETRQQSLGALIDWSYELLDPEEQVVFHRLSVFVGRFSLEAAEAVGGFDPVPAGGVADLVAKLVSKSLVQRRASDGRFRLLETIREYAAVKLDASGERARCEQALVRWARAEAEAAADDARPFAARLERVRLDLDNLRAAIDIAFRGDPVLAAEMVVNLAEHVRLAAPHEAQEMLGRALAADLPTGLRAATLAWLAACAGDLSSVDEVLRLSQEGIALAREAGSWEIEAAAFGRLAWGLAFAGRGEEGIRALDELRARMPAGAQLPLVALISSATCAAILGQVDESESRYREGLAMARSMGHSHYVGLAVQGLGFALAEKGEPAAALPLFEEAFETFSEPQKGRTALNLAWANMLVGDAAAAARWARVSDRLCRQYGDGMARVNLLLDIAHEGGLPPADTVRLHATAQTCLESAGMHVYPPYVPRLAKLRSELGDAAFERLAAAGAADELDQALERAIAALETAASRVVTPPE